MDLLSYATLGFSTIDMDLYLLKSLLPDKKYLYYNIDRGDGITGILNASNISDAKGSDSDLSADILKSGEVVDDVTGTLESGTGGVNRLMGLPSVLI